jgi:hypothetical protein
MQVEMRVFCVRLFASGFSPPWVSRVFKGMQPLPWLLHRLSLSILKDRNQRSLRQAFFIKNEEGLIYSGRSGCKRRVWINRGVTVTKTLILVLMGALVIVSLAGYGQVAGYQTPVDVPTDPRGIGMGESLVALRANPSSLMYNPAGLAGLKGTSLAYAERKMNWFSGLDEFRYYGVSASVETPIGVFGARYDRLSMGVGAVFDRVEPGQRKRQRHVAVIGDPSRSRPAFQSLIPLDRTS